LGETRKTILLRMSEQKPNEFYVLDQEFYQNAMQTRTKYPSEKGYNAVPVVQNDYTTVTLLINSTTNVITALKMVINAKTTPESCIHYYRF